jgi:hypothetical protein
MSEANSNESATANASTSTRFHTFYNACRDNDVDITKQLLESMNLSEVNAIESDGETALHVACRNGHTDIIRLLLDRGASRSIRDKNNSVPYDVSKTEEVRQLLRRTSKTRFMVNETNTSGTIEWMKCGDNVDQQAAFDIYDRTGRLYQWPTRFRDLAASIGAFYLEDTTSDTEVDVLKEFLDQAIMTDNPEYFIKAYTAETVFYRKLNTELARTYDTIMHFMERRDRNYIIYVFRVHQALARYAFTGCVYGGMRVSEDDLKQYCEGSKIMNKAFLSTSKNPDIARQFALKNNNQLQSEEQIQKFSALCVYEIDKEETAIKIDTISEYEYEEEVLIFPYNSFQIIKIKRYNSSDTPSTHVIDVEIYLRQYERVKCDLSNVQHVPDYESDSD